MAKRKTARTGASARGRGTAAGRTAGRSSTRRTGKTPAARAGRKKTAARTPAKAGGSSKAAASRKRSTGGRKASGATRKSGAAKRRSSPKALPRRSGAASARAASGKGSAPTAQKAAGAKRRTSGRATSPSTPPRESFGKRGRAIHDDIERDRRLLEETVDTPPSSLDLDRRASAARSGRAEINEALTEHTATGPALTGGDVDADWQSAYNTGDEAPGGDMPTPDQSVVEDIGGSVGLEYEDNEELKGVDKVEKRDRHRWEYDPASSEDYQERSRKK